jgi:uncharacterized protein (DUF58 family)
MAIFHVLLSEIMPGLIAVVLMSAAMVPLAALAMSAYSLVRHGRRARAEFVQPSEREHAPQPQPPDPEAALRQDFD